MTRIKTSMFLLATLPFLFAIWGCEEGQNIFFPSSGTIYFNSFETQKDTVGIAGYGGWGIQKEAPAGGGKQSLMVSGGCIVPHASIVLPPLSEDGYYRIQFWGKNLAIGGGVELTIQDSWENYIHVSVNEPEWKFLESADSLFCPASQRLVLNLSSGGIVYSAMLVDMVQVVRVQ